MRGLLNKKHGGTDSGASGNGYKEKDLTLKFSLMVRDHLKRCGFTVGMSRTTDTTLSLEQRTAMMKGYNYAVSFHCNSASGTAGNGIEVIVPSREAYCGTAYIAIEARKKFGGAVRSRYAYSKDYNTGTIYSRTWNTPVDTVKSKFNQTYSYTDWYGITRGAWSVGVSADIVEWAFINNPTDIKNFVDNMEKIAEEYSKQMCTAWGKKWVAAPVVTPPTPTVTPYRVRKSWSDAGSQVGAYNDLDGAIAKAKETKLNVYDNTGKEVYKYTAPTEETVSKATYDAVVKERDSLKSQVSALTSDKTNLTNQVNSLNATVADLRKQIEALQNSGSSSAEVETLKKKITELETTIKNYNSALKALQSVV